MSTTPPAPIVPPADDDDDVDPATQESDQPLDPDADDELIDSADADAIAATEGTKEGTVDQP